MVDVGKGLSWHFEIWWCKPFKLHLEINTKWNLNLRFNKLLLTKFRLPSSSEHYKQLTNILTNSTQYKGTYGWKWKYKEGKIITKELQLNIELVCLQNVLICGCHTQSSIRFFHQICTAFRTTKKIVGRWARNKYLFPFGIGYPCDQHPSK